MSLLLPLLGSGVSYVAYTGDLAVSSWPWKIGLCVTAFCFLLPFVVALAQRRTNRVWAAGLILTSGMFAVYFFFGIVAWFFYFAFAPMPPALHWLGIAGGAALTLYWACASARAVQRTLARTSYLEQAYQENKDAFHYRPQAAMRLYERLSKEPSPFPRIYLYVTLAIAPFSLVLARLLTSSFGANGVLFVLAALGMPVSLWFMGVIVRLWLLMVRLPRRLEGERGKPVLIVE